MSVNSFTLCTVNSENETAWQPSIGDLGRPLSETVFVVVDLETSGGSPFAGAGITEIGAVKVCGGQVIGEFQSLVNPGTPIPDYITDLTGISSAMLQDSPSSANILPTFFEFLGSPQTNILVAHNASFDIGFLKAAAREHSYRWPRFKVFDTVALARAVLSKDDVPDCKLSTLSTYFGAVTSPNHRALDDARATVDVLHGIFERFGSLNIRTVEDVMAFTNRLSRKSLS